MSRPRNDLKALHAALQECIAIDPYMAITRLDALLSWAIDSDISSISDLTDHLKQKSGLSSSAVSRNISYWTENQWKKADGTRPEGAGFIELVPDPVDYRRKLMLMTATGEKFLDKLSEKANGLAE